MDYSDCRFTITEKVQVHTSVLNDKADSDLTNDLNLLLNMEGFFFWERPEHLA